MPRTDVLEPIHVDLGARSYEICYSSLASVGVYLKRIGLENGRCLIVSDENVAALYANNLMGALRDWEWDPISITLSAGETTKSLDNLRSIYDIGLSHGIDRKTPVLALGGGVIGDLGGFAAATLLRGLPLIQIPTTLIAQVDSAIGGKTGINHPAGKNLIGSFYQPRLVLADPELLQSLPDREWTSGLAEVVKHALIHDESFFRFLEETWENIALRNPDVVGPLVRRAAAVKAGVVEKDEREAGLRAILNFGHTFAHAIERTAGYGTFTHGEAVAAGMRAALHLSAEMHPELDIERADRLVARIPVPSGLETLDIDDLMSAMQTDKKVQSGRVRFVLLDRIGHAYVADSADRADVENAWRFVQNTR